MSLENGHINFKTGNTLKEELKKVFKMARRESPSMTFSFFIKRLIWKGLKKD